MILGIGLLLPGAMPAPVQAARYNYTYAIDIEFGSLSFYYDYGQWDVDSMSYKASATSTYPADATRNGYPGWYGFDDVANKIKIVNSAEGDRGVQVAISYESLSQEILADAGADVVVKNVAMTVKGVPVENISDVREISDDVVWNGNTVTVPAGSTAIGYVHLSGEPALENGEMYLETAMRPIGMLTIAIASPLPATTP